MKSIFRYIKGNIYIILATILFGLSLVFAYQIFNTLGYFNTDSQTIVGTIYISNYEESQYQSTISSEINTWRNKSTYEIIYQDFTLDIDLDYFVADINSTIENINEGQVNNVYFNISDSNKVLLTNDLIGTFSNDIINEIDFDLLVDTIITHLGRMNILKHYQLENYFESDLSSSILSTVQISNIEEDDVTIITDLLSSVTIDNNSRFSILEKLEALNLTNEQLSILASGILKSTYDTPFSGYIFEQNSNLLSWSEEGANVRILKANNFDFTFYNDLDFDYIIEVSKLDATSIEFSLEGYPFVAEYNVVGTENISLSFETQYIDNEALDETTPNIIVIDTDTETTYRLLIQAGINGKVISYIRTITSPDFSESTSTIFVEIYYPTTELYQENIVLKGSE